jgi:hypothetical protein
LKAIHPNPPSSLPEMLKKKLVNLFMKTIIIVKFNKVEITSYVHICTYILAQECLNKKGDFAEFPKNILTESRTAFASECSRRRNPAVALSQIGVCCHCSSGT